MAEKPVVIRSSELQTNNFGSVNVAEYLGSIEHPEVSITLVEVDGMNKCVRNKECNAHYYVVEGIGNFRLEIDGAMRKFEVQKGDLVYIPVGTAFQDAGRMTLLAVYVPPFNSSQVETLS